MKEYNVYYETDNGSGNMVIKASDEKQAHEITLEILRFDVNLIKITPAD